MNFDISVVCNCNSFLFYVLNKLVPSLHLENLWIPYHYAGRIVSLWDHSFPTFIKKHWQCCCNNQSATSLVFLLSLRSTLQPSWRTSPQQGSRQPVKTKNNRGILRLGLSCALVIPWIYRGSVLLFLKENKTIKKGNVVSSCKTKCTWIFLSVTRCPWPKIHF